MSLQLGSLWIAILFLRIHPRVQWLVCFAAIDQDIGDRHKFTLVEGEGDGDNANFSISGNSLKTVLPFDYEFQRSHTIRVRAEDSAKLAFESVFEIEVDQVNEPPSAIYLVNDTIEENLPKDTLVGPLVAPDPDNIPADGLILRYTFDDPESLGTESVNNRHAEVHGNVTSVEGKIHGAASFPGDKASYMEVPSFEFGGPVSVSTWVRYQKFNSYSRIMDFGNGAGQDNLILANVSSGAGVTWHIRRSSTDKYLRTGSFAKGLWTHVVTTVHESGQLQLFLDGLLVGTNNSGHAPRTLSRSHQLIGLSNWSSDGPFRGKSTTSCSTIGRFQPRRWSRSIYLLQDSWASSRIGWFPARVIRTTNSSISKTIASMQSSPWTMKHSPSSLFVLKLVTRNEELCNKHSR